MASPRPRVRPRFTLATDVPVDELSQRIKTALAATRTIDGIVADDYAELFVGSGTRFWSPQLRVRWNEDDEDQPLDQVVLQCRFGPHPHVWTMYVAMHALGAFTTVAAAVFGYSQHLSGETPWALWALPAAPLLALLVWSMAFVGQSLGLEQMLELRQFLDRTADAHPVENP